MLLNFFGGGEELGLVCSESTGVGMRVGGGVVKDVGRVEAAEGGTEIGEEFELSLGGGKVGGGSGSGIVVDGELTRGVSGSKEVTGGSSGFRNGGCVVGGAWDGL